MRLVIFSHKPCWCSTTSSSGYATDGGFPFQVSAISELFDSTRLVLPRANERHRKGEVPLSGNNLSVTPLAMPIGQGFIRKIGLLPWLTRNIPILIREIIHADAVHTPIPGDIGTLGMLLALVFHKPLFVRYCGTWGDTSTLTRRFLKWLLPRIAGGNNVVLATGGGPQPPCQDNSAVRWIFSTTITEEEWKRLPVAKPWDGKSPLHLITVCRLDPAKNTASIIQALPYIRDRYPKTVLHIVGDGPDMPRLRTLTEQLGLDASVVFHGNLTHEDVMKALSQAHLFVFPTTVKEGFPKAVLEALACGLPVIATRVSVIPYLIGEDRGLVLNDTSPTTVAEAVISLVADPVRMAQMGHRARAYSCQYTLEAWRDTIGTILEETWGPLRSYERS